MDAHHGPVLKGWQVMGLWDGSVTIELKCSMMLHIHDQISESSHKFRAYLCDTVYENSATSLNR